MQPRPAASPLWDAWSRDPVLSSKLLPSRFFLLSSWEAKSAVDCAWRGPSTAFLCELDPQFFGGCAGDRCQFSILFGCLLLPSLVLYNCFSGHTISRSKNSAQLMLLFSMVLQEATRLWLKILKLFITLYIWWLLHWVLPGNCSLLLWGNSAHGCRNPDVVPLAMLFALFVSWVLSEAQVIHYMLFVGCLSKLGSREMKSGWGGSELFSGSSHLLFSSCCLGIWYRQDTSLQGGWGEIDFIFVFSLWVGFVPRKALSRKQCTLI